MPIKHIHYPIITSTHTWGKGNVGQFDCQTITLITANEQTAGRGRFKRTWVAPADVNIYATFCFVLPGYREDIGNIPQVLAIVACDILKPYADPHIKWPNDILLNGKKMGGILTETTTIDGVIWMILSIGLNINMTPEQLGKVDRPATSLHAESGMIYAVCDIVEALKIRIQEALAQFLELGFPPFYPRLLELLVHRKGDILHVSDFYRTTLGTFNTLKPDGALVLDLSPTESRTFTSGEVLDS